MKKTEAQALADTMDFSRQLSLYYFHKLKDTDLHKTFECEGKKLNSAFWVMAHLAVTENYLLLYATGGEMIRFSWARLFGLGSTIPIKEDCPPLEEILEKLESVHQKALQYIRSLSDDDLDKPNPTPIKFKNAPDTLRMVIQHAIRHEGTHTGHLSWLCKLHGIKTI